MNWNYVFAGFKFVELFDKIIPPIIKIDLGKFLEDLLDSQFLALGSNGIQ